MGARLSQPRRVRYLGALFLHYGFGAGDPEIDLDHTAQTWALLLARLQRSAATGTPQPFFPAAAG